MVLCHDAFPVIAVTKNYQVLKRKCNRLYMRSPKGADRPLGKRKVTFLKTNEWSADVTGTEWVRWFGLKQKMEHSRTVRKKSDWPTKDG